MPGFVLVAMLMAGIAPTGAGPGAVITALITAYNAGDAAGAAALFAPTADFAPPDAPPAKGREAIAAAFEERFRSPRALDLLSVDTSVSQGVAVGSGRLTLSTRNRLRGADIRSGSYLVVMHRAGTGWQIAHFMFTLPIQPDFIG